MMMIVKTTCALFLSQINSDTRISSQAVSEIESRHQDIICLESSLKELHEIFVDTAMLIESQVPLLKCLLTRNVKEYTDIMGPRTWLMLILFFFYQGELINNIEKNVTSAAEYIGTSKAETYKAVMYKKNPYKIASLPNFFKPFKRQTTAKTGTDQNTSDLNHDWAPKRVWTLTAPNIPINIKACAQWKTLSPVIKCLSAPSDAVSFLKDNEEAVILNFKEWIWIRTAMIMTRQMKMTGCCGQSLQASSWSYLWTVKTTNAAHNLAKLS